MYNIHIWIYTSAIVLYVYYMKVYYLTWSVAARQTNLCVHHNGFGLDTCPIPRLQVAPREAWLYGANKFRTSCCSVPLVLGWGSRVLLSVGAAELHSSSAASLSDLANSLRSIYNKQGKVQDMCSGHRRYITSCKTHARHFLGGQ